MLGHIILLGSLAMYCPEEANHYYQTMNVVLTALGNIPSITCETMKQRGENSAVWQMLI